MENREKPNVWGVFVGESGDQLEALNSKSGPFPPEPGSEGCIAIGWPAIGDMRLYKDNYPDYIDKFRVVYPSEHDERTFKTTANMPWNFAYAMKEGDWVLCPSSAAGYLLVGKIIGEYIADFHNAKRRVDFVHLRKVKWLYVVGASDARYKKLHRIGMLTVVRPNISPDELTQILNGTK